MILREVFIKDDSCKTIMPPVRQQKDGKDQNDKIMKDLL